MTRRNTMADAERFIVPGAPDECWHWQGRPNGDGYGHFAVGGLSLKAHRVVYELFVGPVPDGMVIDHACHSADPTCPGGACPHRLCVNPAHLEAVTRATNILRGAAPAALGARQTHCKRGHDLTDPSNLKPNGRGARQCRACSNLARRERYLRLGR